MHLLILGRGKTGSLVADLARQRRHHVRVLGKTENVNACALTPGSLSDVDCIIDFTAPDSAVKNIEAVVRAGRNMVIGTTGWYSELPRVRDLIAQAGSGFLFSSNFSIGVNLFFDIAKSAAAALAHEYNGQIFERHHAQKKDSPSGTALTLQRIISDESQQQLEITSFREGDVVGLHELVFDSPNDRIYLCHDAKSRRGYAEGAVRAAEWLAGKKGCFDFRDIWHEL